MGTIDPTPHLNDTAMYTLGTLMIVASISNYLVKPTDRSITPTSTEQKQPMKVISVTATKEEEQEEDKFQSNEPNKKNM
jgi:hypothetical protein